MAHCATALSDKTENVGLQMWSKSNNGSKSNHRQNGASQGER